MRELDDSEVDKVLARQGIGTLSIVDGDHPYAIPMSFGYDGDAPVLFPMQWGDDGDSRKQQLIKSNPNVCLTVLEHTDDLTWRSIIIEGEIYEVTDKDEQKRAYAALATNAQIAPDVEVWGVPFEDVEFNLLSLEVDSISGREFSSEPGEVAEMMEQDN